MENQCLTIIVYFLNLNRNNQRCQVTRQTLKKVYTYTQEHKFINPSSLLLVKNYGLRLLVHSIKSKLNLKKTLKDVENKKRKLSFNLSRIVVYCILFCVVRQHTNCSNKQFICTWFIWTTMVHYKFYYKRKLYKSFCVA